MYEAIERIQNPTPINGKVMFGTALAGVFINIILGLTLHEHHGHGSHSHSHERDSQSQEHGESEHDHLHPTASVDIEEGIAPNIRKQVSLLSISNFLLIRVNFRARISTFHRQRSTSLEI